MPLIREAHRDASVMKGPELFDEAVVQLFGPFALEKRVLPTSLRELRFSRAYSLP